MTANIEQIDPHTLVVDPNIRTSAPLDKGFIDSIAANGVLTPILAWRDDTGAVRVRAGQRRTLGAREAGVATVPVFIVDGEADETQRIIEQIVENDQREGLTDADRIQAWRALELEGVSATAIAKRTGAKRDRIKTGLTVAANDTSAAAVAEFGLTLDQAAALIEFEDDPELVDALTREAIESPDYFPVAVQRAHNDRARAALREKVEAEEASKGHRILDDRPGWNQTPYALRDLTTADGGNVEADSIQGKEGVAVYVAIYGNDDAHPIYYVDEPATLGLTVREGVTASAPQAGPMTEDQKAARKVLIANNKEWDAAESVRRDWLAALLARKTAPKDAQAVIAAALTNARWKVADGLTHGTAIAASLLGIANTYSGPGLTEYLNAHPNRAVQVTLAMILGGIEHGTGRDTWRNPREDTAWYFQTLAAWGYPLCPVEKIAAMIADDTTTDE